MVRLTRVAPDCGAELVAKLEAYNPAGSVKDRIGVAMIDAAEAEGRIEPGRTTIVEATSGNTGIALAFVCAARGYDLVLAMPQGMSREREGLLRLYGAEVRITESMGGMDEAVEAARAHRRRAAATPSSPTSSPTRPTPRSTGARPPRRSGATWTARSTRWWPASAPAARSPAPGERLKERNPRPARGGRGAQGLGRCCPAGGPGPHKIQGIGAGFVPPVLNRDVVDEIIAVDDEDAIETARACARTEGVLAGISCGAALWAAIQVGSRPEMRGKRDRGGHARLGRALREHAVLRPLVTLSAARARALLAPAADGRVGRGRPAAAEGRAARSWSGSGALGSPVAAVPGGRRGRAARRSSTATRSSCPTCTASRCTSPPTSGSPRRRWPPPSSACSTRRSLVEPYPVALDARPTPRRSSTGAGRGGGLHRQLRDPLPGQRRVLRRRASPLVEAGVVAFDGLVLSVRPGRVRLLPLRLPHRAARREARRRLPRRGRARGDGGGRRARSRRSRRSSC